jgi:flavin-dependent dehydrogenase
VRHSHSYDVLVAGAGPAGSAAALDLSRRGLSVALIEQDRYETRRVGETLPPMIRQQLTGLGIWERFLECDPLESYGIRTAWEEPTPRHQDFIQNPYGCGWHVDRARFDAVLASAAAEAGATLFLPVRAGSSSRSGDGAWTLEVAQDGVVKSLSGRMLVDATGRKAMLASRMGGKAQVADRLIGAVSFCESSNSDAAQWTLIEAVEDGWWYSVPLPAKRSGVDGKAERSGVDGKAERSGADGKTKRSGGQEENVAGMVFAYMTDSDLWMETDRKWDELLELAPLTFERAGRRPIPRPSQIVSAASVVRSLVAGPGWMAIGDAALAFDPLSGQGVFKSIETGTRCGSAIARYFAGDLGAPAEYETWVNETYQSYLATRAQFYSSVGRWPGSRFWKRRAAF